jgi:hypothetical protein
LEILKKWRQKERQKDRKTERQKDRHERLIEMLRI